MRVILLKHRPDIIVLTPVYMCTAALSYFYSQIIPLEAKAANYSPMP